MKPSRSAWLDALRGIAALVVVFDHSSYTFLPEVRRELMPEFNTSRYGIMVFFLVSGYLIPASLERRGHVREFWIGRIFRVYPLWAVVVAALLALHLAGVAGIRELDGQSVYLTALAHVTMLQELLGTPNLLLVLWTLSYEMSFYLLVVALFTLRLHRHSGTIAVFFAVASVVAGATVPASALSGAVGRGPLIVCASVAMVVAICCANAWARVLGGALGLVLIALNGTVPTWEGLVILAVMFLGTAIYRAGWGSWRVALVVVGCAVGSSYAYGSAPRGWITAFLLAVLTFGVGLASRRRRTPRVLAGLGTVSYSVYLVHPLLLAVIDGTVGRRREDSWLLEVAFCAVLLPVCVLTYRYVEVPGQEWGRALARRMRSRWPTEA
ncbi:acyltransferase family protein [Streptomyces acidiscabies]|uniref:Acyltransferase n=1 Tax=Streptomyces acidiscabies TaxID=42234 RepID=A0AAP6EKT8_9ACTN|nr:acyltransferase [Streptomyces acidiscabies]MBP5938763.1 acyltransferase [Streptomyces sp. LBUM 1476]MBZ3909873.1 acyltransferase [Streptomyces acidiscabies]MDX2966409.1 acyltransferase [Streptomyces acidiscabies]MDX3020564.1 acyltransferase [Streptomyces acidiscabies]MDX3796340.1 acyltransferase [Streptomyces acidiscabies]